MNPYIILADEPTGNLDPANRQLVLEILDESCGAGRTVVMATHDRTAAQSDERRLVLSDAAASEKFDAAQTGTSSEAA